MPPFSFPLVQRVGLMLTLFLVFLLFSSREPPWNDAKPLHQVAESIVKRGALDVPGTGTVLHAGKAYASHPLLVSLVHVPGAWIHQKVIATAPRADAVARAFTSHLAPAALGALIGLLFALLCRDLGTRMLTAQVGAATVALGTMVAVYARSPWSEIVQTAAFLGFFLYLLRLARAPASRTAFLAGLWAAMLVNTKLVYVLCLPGALMILAPPLWRLRDGKRVGKLLGWAVLGFLPGLLTVLAYNHLRTGSMTGTGYGDGVTRAMGGGDLVSGLWGLFLSPGKSVFLYSPPLIVAALALPWALRTHGRTWFWALLALGLPPVLLYAHLPFWSGDWCWGPRYILFLVPVMLIPAVLALDAALARGKVLALAASAVVLSAGVAVQVAGGSIYWDHFIRISQEARVQWLGVPNRGGATSPDRGGKCDPCFEDFHGFNWLPPFSPVQGHFWLLRHLRRGDDWIRASADAPWHKSTTLPLFLGRSYPRARLDWWYLDFETRFPAVGRQLLWGMSGALIVALALWSLGGWRPRRPRRALSAARTRHTSYPPEGGVPSPLGGGPSSLSPPGGEIPTSAKPALTPREF
jgi:hypothetical protein